MNHQCGSAIAEERVGAAVEIQSSFRTVALALPLTNVDIRESGGRDLNKRPDNQSQPEDTLKGVESA